MNYYQRKNHCGSQIQRLTECHKKCKSRRMKREVKGQEKSLRSAHKTDIIWKLFPERVTILSTRYIWLYKETVCFLVWIQMLYIVWQYNLQVDVNIPVNRKTLKGEKEFLFYTSIWKRFVFSHWHKTPAYGKKLSKIPYLLKAKKKNPKKRRACFWGHFPCHKSTQKSNLHCWWINFAFVLMLP